MGSFLSKSAPTPTSRQVICESSDKQHIAVDLDVLRRSGTFDRMYCDLGLQEHETFPGVFPVGTIYSRIFTKVILWLNEHKDPSLVVEKDPLTQECKWFTFTKCERRFFDVSMEELLELVMAALYLDIPSLEHYACQAIAARIKDQQPADVRSILRQRDDLSLGECADILAQSPWLDPETTVRDTKAAVSDLLHIPSEVLVTVFAKLSRADLECLQLVNAQFRDVILTVNKLGEELGPLRPLIMVSIGSPSSGHRIHPREGTHIVCRDHFTLVQRLKFCAMERFIFVDEFFDEPLHELLPAKTAWKNATIYAFPSTFNSEETFMFAFSELLLCKKIRFAEDGASVSAVPRSFLRLPAMAQCNELDISNLWLLLNSIEVHDIVEWLERDDRKKRDEPSRLTIARHAIDGGPHELIEALKKVFLAASRANAYVVRIRKLEAVDVDEQYHENKTTHEHLHVRKDRDIADPRNLCVLVERN
ncbi:S-phase kinase-associated protein 1A [Aphelenchoides avenae]|nr:S-phase kinase-associated protein 1A [Aphelenchus avenae]